MRAAAAVVVNAAGDTLAALGTAQGVKEMNIAIVEDDGKEAEALLSYIKKYGEKSGTSFDVKIFSDAENFLESYKQGLDIVFMDIELPGMNGMDASKRLRALDRSVTLIFVTNMARFAVNGYEVGAFDFIVKPVTYGSFEIKFRYAPRRFAAQIRVRTRSPIRYSYGCEQKRNGINYRSFFVWSC